ncbi:uncharacterized protein LOC129770953 isoform X2 [Toxorhynchites rutilus septentrionalis]|uniref:uncharacterized protein LOC129770953 isoform X2 n=1 Tax=Toxorhynchites rutilus septentrionalis TaxID=329112 RepID=UPI002479CEBD|nr:uncharacterized protein LOC129770953 isoform X2 [Toxorhynchites rutilus septentrionalis]
MIQSNVLRFVSLAVFAVTIQVTFTLECKDIHRREMEIVKCCSAPEIIQTDGLRECFEDMEEKKMLGCAIKCLLEKRGLLIGDEINEEKLLARIDSFEGEWKDTASNILKECSDKMRDMKAMMANMDPSKEVCNPTTVIYSLCIGKKSIESCPTNEWNDSELCNLVRSGKCDSMKRGPN